MIATHKWQETEDNSANLQELSPASSGNKAAKPHLTSCHALVPLQVAERYVTHHPQAGLNPLVDSASYLFSLIGKLNDLTHQWPLSDLQKELLHELASFQQRIQQFGYSEEYAAVCLFILCSTFDDLILNKVWQEIDCHWQPLVQQFCNEIPFPHTFFSVLERTLSDPDRYIDLMELIYLCFSLGYKGEFRATMEHQETLEQIIHNLYKHIEITRGGVSKILAPPSLRKAAQLKTTKRAYPLFNLFMATACTIMVLFIGLGLITDFISNEAYKNLSSVSTPGKVFHIA